MKKTKKKPNSGKALTAEKREKMFQVFFETGTVNSVRIKCKIHVQTALKYRKVDNWDKRVEEIKRKAADKSDNNAAKRIADNIKLVLYAKQKLMIEIKDKGIESNRRIPDLDKLIRLEMDILGDTVEQHYGDITINVQMVQVGTESPKTRGVDSKIIDEA